MYDRWLRPAGLNFMKNKHDEKKKISGANIDIPRIWKKIFWICSCGYYMQRKLIQKIPEIENVI